MQHQIFSPVITLALPRKMTASGPDRGDIYPVDRIRKAQLDLILWLSTGTGMPGGP
jgi:hypothetical protein